MRVPGAFISVRHKNRNESLSVDTDDFYFDFPDAKVRSGDVDGAAAVLHSMREMEGLSVKLCMALIQALAKQQRFKKADEWIEIMKSDKISHTVDSYPNERREAQTEHS